MFFGFKTKAGDPFLGVLGADGAQDLNGNHVFGLCQTASQGHRAFKSAIVIFRLPGLPPGHTGIEKKWRIVDDGGGLNR